jgi:hypothetical protein
VFLLLLFPTGRLLSPRWRPVARFATAVYIINVVGYAFAPGPQSFGPLPNPLGIQALADLAPVAQAVATGLGLVAVLAAVTSLLRRLRRARGVERQQLKWFCYAAALFPFAVLVAVAFPSLGRPAVDGLIVVPALLALPAAIGIAVLRYRLYEIDRLINRTLVYGLLTALLAAVYAGVVLVLGWLFGGLGAQPPSWRSPAPPWPWPHCSSRPVAASSKRWTGASTGVAMTPARPSMHLASGSVTKLT